MGGAHATPWSLGGEHHGWAKWVHMAAGRHGPFGSFPPSGGPGAFGPAWGGPRVPRGNVRAAILALLAEEPRNGYQIIQEIGERSGGLWRPSAGSVYPALQQLEDEGLVRAVEDGARRVFELTDEGRAHVEARADELAEPWKAACGSWGRDAVELRELIGQVAGAAVQVVRAGTSGQAAEARRVLADARRSLYRILAEDGDARGDAGVDGTGEGGR